MARYSLTDISLGVAGILLAGASVAFPWHVYMNPDKYGPPRIAFSGNWHPGEPEEEPPVILARKVTPLVSVPRVIGLDSIVTGTTPEPDAAAKKAAAVPLEDQPSPTAGGDYGVIFVINRTALMSDAAGVFFIEVGQKLPDGSTVTGVTDTADGGEVRTSYDRVYRPRS